MSPPISRVGKDLIWSTCLLWTVATTATVVRFIARKALGNIGSDDWTILLGLVIVTSYCIVNMLFATVGHAGYNALQLTKEEAMTSSKYFFVMEMHYSVENPIIKTSILLLYRRIFDVRTFRHVLLVVNFLVIVWGFGTLFSSIFQCTPIRGFWDPPSARHCIDEQAFFHGNGISNLLLDCLILCLPMPMIWRLQLGTKRKLALTGMFLMGSVVCVTSIVRVTTLKSLNGDTSTQLPLVQIWSTAEVCVAIMSASLPTFGPIIREGVRRFRSTRARSTDFSGQIMHNKPTDEGYRELSDPWHRKPRGAHASAEAGLFESQAGTESGNEIALDAIQVRKDVSIHAN